MTDALLKPFYQIVTAPPRQWHPVLVHFPIAFLVLEAVLLSLWRVTGKTAHEPWAYAFLHASLWSMLIVAIAGLHDAGLNLGAGNRLWLGLQDRWRQAFRWHSSVTVHSWLALALLAITAARLLWRKFVGPGATRWARLGIWSDDFYRLMDFDRRGLCRWDDQRQMIGRRTTDAKNHRQRKNGK